jgi:TatD DNase family protein
MISIGVAILSNVKLQKSLEMIPNDRLLIETDNSKMNILEVYKKVSEIKKISLLELENLIEDNFKRTFKKWQIG